MRRIYSYVIRYDDGAAPNPFWGVCTLTICKPAIRRNAQVGDWVIGTGSKHAVCSGHVERDLSNHLVYAMKVTCVKSLRDYDAHCRKSLNQKIPIWTASDWTKKVGDCIYDYGDGLEPAIRIGVHSEASRKTDLSGCNALLSDYFYYFGEEAMPLEGDLLDLIKRNQGHKKIEKLDLIDQFEDWIQRFERGKLYGNPQMKWLFDSHLDQNFIAACESDRCQDDEAEAEESIC